MHRTAREKTIPDVQEKQLSFFSAALQRKPQEAVVRKTTRPTLRRAIRTAKYFTFLLLILSLQVNARSYGQISLHVESESLEKVLLQVKKQSGLAVVYQDQLMKRSKPVTISVRNVTVQQALTIIFKDQDLTWELVGDKIISIREKNQAPAKQQVGTFTEKSQPPIEIRGRVVDAKTGEPLVGANIYLKESQVGVSTNEKGEFIITMETAGVLQISMAGYQSVEERANESNASLVVRLQMKVQELNAVVAVGYFNRKKSTYTGSAVTYNNDDLRKVGNANTFQALRNLVPSMFVDNFSMGSSPNAMPDIRLRGTSTFNDLATTVDGVKGNYIKNPNEPLFILDGFEASVERIFDLDINRIESITILKDAASKAVYGAKAANGVVVVETKKSVGNRVFVHYNGSLDIEVPDLTSYNLANANEKLDAEVLDGFYKANDIQQSIIFQQMYNQRRKLALEGLNTDWIAKPLREGIGHKHTVGIELGNQGLNVIGDLSYRDVQGVMKGSYRKNMGGNLTASYRVRNFLFRNIMSITANKAVESPYGSFGDYVKMNPYWIAQNEDGSIPFYAEINPYDNSRVTNPLFNSTTNTRYDNSYFNFSNNFYLEWMLNNQLRIVGRFGVDHKTSEANAFEPSNHTRFDAAEYSSDEGRLRKGNYQLNNGKSSYVSGDLNVNYRNVFGRSVIGANAGVSVSERKFHEVIHRVEGFSSDRMEDVTFGRGYALNSRPTGIASVTRDLGGYFAANYSFDERFLADFSFRGSASSQFGANHRWGLFYSLGLGYNLHNEAAIKRMLPFVDELRVRGSLGTSGNPNFMTNVSIATYQYYPDALYQGFPGTYLVSLSNPDLRWENKLDYNVGLDVRIRRFSGRIDYYNSYTENLVTPISVVPSTGFSTVYENLGKVQNTGIEAYLSYNVYQKGRDFVNVYGSIETNLNKILSLSNAMKAYNDRMTDSASFKGNSVPVKRYYEGGSLHTIWAVPSLGIDPATGLEVYQNHDGTTTNIWDANNMVNAGYGSPRYQGTFGVNLEIKGWGLNVTARYLGGGQLYNQTLVDRVENVNMLYNVDKRVLTGRWTAPGQDVLYKKLGQFSYDPDGDGVFTSLQEVTRATTRFVQDRNELDIAAVNLYYLFQDRIVKKLGMQRLKVAFNMNEIGKFSSIQIERGTSYPFSRTMSLSISATF
jgi:TonB-linked SusC/RagA family outer membrane protein